MTKAPDDFRSPIPLTGTAGERGTHWCRHAERGRLWLTFDKQGTDTNTFDEAVFDELDALIDDICKAVPEAVIFRSAKRKGFAAGADIHQFRGIAESGDVLARIEAANRVIDRLAALDAITIAVVHGICVGGGLELALACDRIIARKDARLGFPEVKLGLHPGLGGTARLTRRIAPTEAMKLMLTGKMIDARRALELGLVDLVCEERNIANAVEAVVEGRVEARGGGVTTGAMNSLPARKAIAPQMRRETEKRAPKEHYPAPYALIELWEKHGGSEKDMLEAERHSFARLIPTDTAQNLIRTFFLREKLKANGKGASDIGHVHVVGGGTMGADIGAWCAFKGMRVTIEDPDHGALGRAVKSAAELFDHKLDGPERIRARDRFIPDPAGDGARRADLVIEAVPEKPELKRKIYEAAEARMKDGAILATNTSSLDLAELSQGLQRPERFVGLHFFNPVSRLDLVEVVRHEGTDGDLYQQAQRFVTDIDKLPLPVAAAPGFLVNRALMPYLLEALLMIDEGVQCERIDAAAERFGMPMGPVELADQVGLDICLDVADSLGGKLDRPLPEIPGWLREKVQRGELGRKSGKGLYEYDGDGDPRKAKIAEEPTEAMRDRLILPMLNSIAAMLSEGVVADSDSADAAMIFATGFAPFRGGPMHYAKTRGFGEVREALRGLEQEHGERFAPHEWWSEAAG